MKTKVYVVRKYTDQSTVMVCPCVNTAFDLSKADFVHHDKYYIVWKMVEHDPPNR